MLVKSEQDEIQSFLADSSNMKGGHASRVLVPESSEEVAEALARASRERTPVTVAGAGTGVVGGRVPFGGIVLATDRLDRIKEITKGECGGRASVEAGVVLSDLRRAVESQGLLSTDQHDEGAEHHDPDRIGRKVPLPENMHRLGDRRGQHRHV